MHDGSFWIPHRNTPERYICNLSTRKLSWTWYNVSLTLHQWYLIFCLIQTTPAGDRSVMFTFWIALIKFTCTKFNVIFKWYPVLIDKAAKEMWWYICYCWNNLSDSNCMAVNMCVIDGSSGAEHGFKNATHARIYCACFAACSYVHHTVF